MKFCNTTLGDISVNNKGNYGIAVPAVSYNHDLYRYLRITDILDDGTVSNSNIASVDDKDASKYLLRENDIVFARTGASTGRNYFYNSLDGELVYAGYLIKFTINEKVVNPIFIKYYCRSSQYWSWVASFNSGSTRGNINAQVYSSMPIKLPPREQQDFLVEVLSTIDSKIRINKKINDNLEEQANQIYRNTFIKNAKEKWNTGKLSDLIQIRYGKDHKILMPGEYPVFGSGGIMRYGNSFLYDKESVLIPRKGTLNNIIYIDEPFWSVDTMFYTIMKQSNIAKFIYYLLKSKDLASMNSGSAVPSMTTDILNSIELKIPDNITLLKFEDIVGPMFKIIKNNKSEIKTLIQLRNNLLPRLMSGKIDVSKIKI